MIMDFGGKEHIWVRFSKKELDEVRAFAETAREAGVTFSSVVMQALREYATKENIEQHVSELEMAQEDRKPVGGVPVGELEDSSREEISQEDSIDSLM